MTKPFANVVRLTAAAVVLFTACAKTESVEPEKTANHDKPQSHIPAGGTKKLQLKVQAVIKAGEIVYDNIPASLTLISWDSAQVTTEKLVELQPGVNEIALPPSAVKYQLKINKWGVAADTVINAASLPYAGTVQLGGAKAAKLLTREDRYMLKEGNWTPDGRVEYYYHTPKVLSSVSYFSKTTQQQGLVLTKEDVFMYRDGRLNRINHYGEDGSLYSVHNFTFTGNDISAIRENAENTSNVITAAISYQPAASQLTFNYRFANGNTMDYTQRYSGGNLVEEVAVSSRGTGESGKLTYDTNINPFAHLNYPDIFLSRRSKNNKIGEEKTYKGNIPTSVPYKFEYKYDADGYPTELLTSFKGFTSNEHLFVIKTIYTY